MGSEQSFVLACFRAAKSSNIRPSTNPQRDWLHPPLQFFSLRVPSSTSRSSPFGVEHYLPGFLPSSRHHRSSSTITRVPILASFRPRAFSAPRRLAPCSGLRACFVSLPRAGFSPFRDLIPILGAFRLFAGCSLRVVSLHSLTGIHRRPRLGVRLRGFVPRIDRNRRARCLAWHVWLLSLCGFLLVGVFEPFESRCSTRLPRGRHQRRLARLRDDVCIARARRFPGAHATHGLWKIPLSRCSSLRHRALGPVAISVIVAPPRSVPATAAES